MVAYSIKNCQMATHMSSFAIYVKKLFWACLKAKPIFHEQKETCTRD